MKIHKIGDNYTLVNDSVILDKLPNGIYELIDPLSKTVRKVHSLKAPKKIYGDLNEKVDMISKSFNNGASNLGVWLSGDKGSGKSVTISVLAESIKIPVIIVSGKREPSDICNFLSSLDQEIMVSFDEFDKNYHEHGKQEEFLTLFDGVASSKKLFIISTNTSHLSEYFTNRLGRIRYHFRYNRVTDDIRDEIILNELKNQDYKSALLDVLEIIGNVSIDNLLKFIEEVNLSNKNPIEIAPYLNFHPEDAEFTFVVLHNGIRGEGKCYTHPLSHDKISGWFQYKKEGQTYPEYVNYTFDLKKAEYYRDDADRLVITEGNNKIKFTKVRPFELKFG